MGNLNNRLKVLFILLCLVLLFLLVSSPKTHCQSCSLEHEGKYYDGYDAFDFYEKACITYAKPWSSQNDVVNLTEGYLK